MNEEQKYRSFHQAIVAIVVEASRAELPILARLVTSTKIPRDHERILEAFVVRGIMLEWEGMREREWFKLLKASLWEQMEAAQLEKEAEEERSST